MVSEKIRKYNLLGTECEKREMFLTNSTQGVPIAGENRLSSQVQCSVEVNHEYRMSMRMLTFLLQRSWIEKL